MQIEKGVPTLDACDQRPNYYMSLEVAKQETVDWLKWRLCKVSPYSAELSRVKATPNTMTYTEIINLRDQ